VGEAREALSGLLHERRAAYAECHAVVHTDDAEPETIAELIQKVEADPPVVVALGERTYRVEIGSGVRGRLFARAASASIGDVVVVTDESVRAPWADEVITSLTDGGRRVTTVTLPAGESAKHIGAVEQIWDVALSFGIDRTSMVLAVGGGVVGDLAGFAAATLLRGVAFGQMPTTLLSMVDASVGGKNGFDRKEGKNLVGAFHQPAFVLCDIEVLRTLPRAERVAVRRSGSFRARSRRSGPRGWRSCRNHPFHSDGGTAQSRHRR
jgi:hypothetical protein